MSAPASEIDPATRLGRAVAQRMRLPGPPLGRPRPARVGSLAQSAVRFAAAASRPVAVRRTLDGPGPARVNSFRDAGVQPPRWWTPPHQRHIRAAEQPHAPVVARQIAPDELPARGLPRAVRRVPDEQTYTPGGIVGSLVAGVAQVRRYDAVAAAGPMLTQQDRAKLTATSTAGHATARRTTTTGPVASRSYSGRQAPPPPTSPLRRPGTAPAPGAPPSGQSSGGGSGPSTPTGGRTASGSAARTPAAPHAARGVPGPGAAEPPARDGARGRHVTAAAAGLRTAAVGPGWRPTRVARFARVGRVAADDLPVSGPGPVAGVPAAAGRTHVESVSRTAVSGIVGSVSRTAVSGIVGSGEVASGSVLAAEAREPVGSDEPWRPASSSTALGTVPGSAVRTPLARSGAAGPTALDPLRRSVGGTRRLRRAVGSAHPLRPGLRMPDAAPRLVAVPSPASDGPRTAGTGRPRLHAVATPRPAIVPAATVPAATVPAGTVPAATVPAATVPAATVPAATVPAATVPAATVPAATVPAATVPAATVPAATVPAATPPAATPPAATGPSATGPSASGPSAFGTAPPGAASPSSAAAAAPSATGATRQRDPAPAAHPLTAAPALPFARSVRDEPTRTGSIGPAAPAAPAALAAETNPAGGAMRALRRRLAAEPPGLGVASYRPLRNAARPGVDLRPAMSVQRLPAVGALPATAPSSWSRSVTPPNTTSPPGGASRVARRSDDTPSAAFGSASMPTATTPARAATATAPSAHTATPAGYAPVSRTEPARGPAAPGLAAVAMPDLLTVHRISARGAQPQRAGLLATAFGADEPIRPSTSAGPGAAAVAPSTATAAPTRAGGHATRPGAGPARPGAGAGAATGAGPGPRGASSAGHPRADRRGPATVIPRAYLPAPPPVSIRRPPATTEPPVPVVARGTSSTNRAPLLGVADAVLRRSSFVESTAGLFRAADAATAPTIRRVLEGQGASTMAENLPSPLSVSGPGYEARGGSHEHDDLAVPNEARQLDELVDKVVARIEQRVVDELERRGRRQTPGAF